VVVTGRMSVTSHRFEAGPTVDSHGTWRRIRLSTGRPFMSWRRTTTTLVGCGFTIVQRAARRFSVTGVLAFAVAFLRIP